MSYKPPKLVAPPFPTFYKAFGSAVVEQTEEILVANHVLLGMTQTLEVAIHTTQLNLHEIYVVCPQYTDKITGELADCQLTITGTPFKEEPFDFAASREIPEETGIFPTKINIRKSFHYFDGYKRPVQNFWCEIDSQTPLFPQSFASAATASPAQDDKSRKIQILAFGKLSEFQTLLSGTLHPPPSKDTDPTQNKQFYITGIRLVSIIDVMDIVGVKQHPHAPFASTASETAA